MTQLLARLPLRLLHALGGCLGWAIYGMSPTYRGHLRENLAAVSLKLAACDQFLLDQTFAPDTVSGARYNEAGLALLQLIEGVEMDVGTRRYETFAELYQYCIRVASAVGEGSISIAFVHQVLSE